MMAANYRHIGGLENRLGRHYSRFSTSWPAAPLAAQSLARRKLPNHGSNRPSQASSVAATTLATAGEVTLQGNPINPAAPPSEFTLASPVRIRAPNVVDPYAST